MASRIGRQIELLLEEREITRKELAAAIGVTEAAICRYISGDRDPKAITVSKIAKVLGVSMDELCGTSADSESDMNQAVRLIARNAQSITPGQRRQLIDSLMGFKG